MSTVNDIHTMFEKLTNVLEIHKDTFKELNRSINNIYEIQKKNIEIMKLLEERIKLLEKKVKQ